LHNSFFNLNLKKNSMKNLLFLLLVVLSASSFAQIFNFNDSLINDGWTYYDDFSSSPSAAFSYDSAHSRLSYTSIKSTETSVLYAPITDSIGGNDFATYKAFTASFKITSKNMSNGFYPLILSENKMEGEHMHPWRDNPTKPLIAGPVNDNDILAVLLSSSQVQMLAKSDDKTILIKGFETPFYLSANTDYWIALQSSDTKIVTMSVFSDSLMLNALAVDTFNVPSLSAFKYLYIANSNGNSSTNHTGYLDNYIITRDIITSSQVVASGNIIDFYPNPVTNVLSINSKSPSQYKICDLRGQVLTSGIGNLINVDYLNAGTYILSITTKNEVLSKLFVKN